MEMLADRILILPDPTEQKTRSGIIIADTVTSTEQQYITGRVVAVGGGRSTECGFIVPCEVKPGDRVLYNRHAAHELDVADIAHHQVRNDDCVAVFVE